MAKRKPTDWTKSLEQFDAHQAEQERSELTRQNYGDDLRAFAAWYQEKYQEAPQLADLSATELRAWKEWLVKERGLMPQTVNRRLAAVRSFLKWAEGAEIVAKPIQVPKTERQETPKPRWLTVKEEHRLVRAIEKTDRIRDAVIVTLFLHVGLRVSELAALLWSDITFTDGKRKATLTVRKGKGRKRRTVPLNVEARNALIELGYEKHEGTKQPIFSGQRGAMTARGIQSTVESFRHEAKLPTLTCHVLRHTFCKRMAEPKKDEHGKEKRTPLEVIAALAGHESIETTRRYVEPGQEDLEAAVESRAAAG